jgi:hypothetical protein
MSYEESLKGRARVPARREGVPEANGVFSILLRKGCGLREPRIAGTRSFPGLIRQPPGRFCGSQIRILGSADVAVSNIKLGRIVIQFLIVRPSVFVDLIE